MGAGRVSVGVSVGEGALVGCVTASAYPPVLTVFTDELMLSVSVPGTRVSAGDVEAARELLDAVERWVTALEEAAGVPEVWRASAAAAGALAEAVSS